MANDGNDNNEQTGPHPKLMATRSEGNVVVNTKAIIALLALLLGGTVGGGGITLATKNDRAPSAVTAPEVTLAFADVNQKLANIAVTLAEMKTQLVASSKEDEKRDALIGDHESRIRKLEERLRVR